MAPPSAPPPHLPTWTLIALLLAAAAGARAHSTDIRVHEGNLRDLLSTSESIALTGNGEDAEFALVRPQVQYPELSSHGEQGEGESLERHHRRRRSAGEQGADRREVEVTVPACILGRHFRLRLSRSAPLLDPHFALLQRGSGANLTDSLQSPPPPPHLLDGLAEREAACLYRGQHAALHMCDRVTRGIILDEHPDANGVLHYYLLQSLPPRLQPSTSYGNASEGATHVLLKRSLPKLPVSDVEDAGSVCGLRRNAPRGEDSGRQRSRREAAGGSHMLPAVHIETAVFVDRDLLQHMALNFPVDTEREVVRFVLAMVNAVQLLYESPSLGRPVRLALKRLELLHAEPSGLRRSHDIDRFLSSFCAWQANSNPGDDAHPLHWDHALILTGLDLYVVGKGGKVSSQVVGLAPVAGMCSASSCTVNEGRHFESVYVVAHEIGHNLGMRHDGPLSDNDCDPGSFLMSPTLGSGKTTWSACSRQYLQTFLQSSQSRCLLDGPGPELLDHSSGGLLPGERFDADQQCMLKYGRGAVHSEIQPLQDACRDLHCRRDRYTWTSHPALDGTGCGRNKWCRSGRCVSRAAGGLSGGVVDGGWSDWSPFSDCASGCLSEDSHPGVHSEPDELRGSTGIMVSMRRCNNPRPENGGRPCEGSDRRYRSCPATQCGNVARTTIRDFADQTCGRARDVQPTLLGTGLQMTSDNPHEACSVWCHVRSGGARPRAWSFPDGTACSKRSQGSSGSVINTANYCVGGRCEEFRCDPADSLFSLSGSRCDTGSAGGEQAGRASTLSAASAFVQRLRDKGRRREAADPAPTPEQQRDREHASGCHSSCVTPGSGLRLVKPRGAGPCRGNCTLQLCEPDVLSCGRLRTPFELASALCTKFRARVRRLSGLGMQISAADEDRDRPCRVACQDEAVPHRFYLVNGRDGWFPFGTDCSRGKPIRAFCVSGRCLEFGSDGTPLHETEISLPLPARDRRRRRRHLLDSSQWSLHREQ